MRRKDGSFHRGEPASRPGRLRKSTRNQWIAGLILLGIILCGIGYLFVNSNQTIEIIQQTNEIVSKVPLSSEEVVVMLWEDTSIENSWSGLGLQELHLPNYLGHYVSKPLCNIGCRFIPRNTSLINQVDAILFEPSAYNGLWYRRSLINLPETFPSPLQKWIMFGYETPVYFPLYNESRYIAHMDISMTYEKKHHSIPHSVQVTFACNWGGTTTGESLPEFLAHPVSSQLKPKLPAAAFMASNCQFGGADKRTQYVAELMKYFPVASYGKCLHNTDLPKSMKGYVYDNHGLAMQNIQIIYSKYKFVLVFENCNLTDYVTEKLYNAFKAGSLPIYMGAPNIDEWVPRNSIIKTSDFKGPQQLAQYLNRLVKDEDLYSGFFKWKSTPYPSSFVQHVDRCVFYGAECRLCNHLAELRPAKSFQSFAGWKRVVKQDSFPPVMHDGFALRIVPKDGVVRVFIPDDSSLRLSGHFTLSAWIWLRKPGFHTIISKDFSETMCKGGFRFAVFSSGVSSEEFERNAENDTEVENTSSISHRMFLQFCNCFECFEDTTALWSKTWYHVTVVFSYAQCNGFGCDRFIRFYITGSEGDSFIPGQDTNTILNKNETKPLFIGGAQESENHNEEEDIFDGFDGVIDSVSLWNVALEKQIISRLPFRKLLGNELGLVAYWPLDEGYGRIVHDASNNKVINRKRKYFDGRLITDTPSVEATAWVKSSVKTMIF